MSTKRLETQIAFLLEADRLKTVLRHTRLADGSRRENSAEHCWHVALAAMVLAEHANQPDLDLWRVVQMLLIHDLVEIDAGDTLVYARAEDPTLAARECAAAERLFGLLPADMGQHFRQLWEEFRTRATGEAKFAAALDRLLPIVLNAATGGRTWREHGITLADVQAANRHMEEGSSTLWRLARSLAAKILAEHSQADPQRPEQPEDGSQ